MKVGQVAEIGQADTLQPGTGASVQAPLSLKKTSELAIPPRKSRVPALCRVSSAPAQVVKLVDTLASGASGRKAVEVQVLSWAPFPKQRLAMQDHTADPPSYECRERVSCVEGPQDDRLQHITQAEIHP